MPSKRRNKMANKREDQVVNIGTVLASFVELNKKLLAARDQRQARQLYENQHSAIDRLAKEKGIILCFASDQAKADAEVATKETFNSVCMFARQAKYRDILFGNSVKFDDVQDMLDFYQKYHWADFRVNRSPDQRALRLGIYGKLKQKYPSRTDREIDNIINAKACGDVFNNNPLERVGSTNISNAGGHINTRLLPTGIAYTEYDATIFVDNRGRRDSERFVRGNNEKVYYTGQHYATFIRVK